MSIKITKDNTQEAIDRIEQATLRALRAGGAFVQKMAIQNITNNKSVDTGRLRASISYNVNNQELVKNTQSVKETQINDKQIGGKRNAVVIGTNVEYAPFVELGTSRMSAKPYLNNAVTDNKLQLQRIIAQEYQKGLK